METADLMTILRTPSHLMKSVTMQEYPSLSSFHWLIMSLTSVQYNTILIQSFHIRSHVKATEISYRYEFHIAMTHTGSQVKAP